MKFNDIAVLGAGIIGSRHVQSLCNSYPAVRLHVVDPAPGIKESLESILGVGSEGLPPRVQLYPALEGLPALLDLVISATTADLRWITLDALLRDIDVRYLLLEKIVFQRECEYEYASSLFDSLGIRAWVNCPRRMMSEYSMAGNILRDTAPLTVSVRGGNWGLACNAIHYIDLVAWWSGENVIEVDITGLHDVLYPAKREGCFEVAGEMSIRYSGGSRLSLFSNPDIEGYDKTISAVSAAGTLELQESVSKVHGQYDVGEEKGKLGQDFVFQSILTGKIVEEIESCGSCGLPGFHDSFSMHLPLINALLTHFEKVTGTTMVTCPIT